MYERGMAMRIGLREGAGTGACLGSGAVPPAARPRRLTGGAGRTLAPAWGNPSSADRRLWSARDAAGLAPDRDIEAGWRLDAEVGYGLRSSSGPGVVTPYAAFSVGEGAGRILRTGTRWRLAPGATLGLEASRAGSPSGDEGPVNALTLRAAVRW